MYISLNRVIGCALAGDKRVSNPCLCPVGAVELALEKEAMVRLKSG